MDLAIYQDRQKVFPGSTIYNVSGMRMHLCFAPVKLKMRIHGEKNRRGIGSDRENRRLNLVRSTLRDGKGSAKDFKLILWTRYGLPAYYRSELKGRAVVHMKHDISVLPSFSSGK
jgi:hypothetical protein